MATTGNPVGRPKKPTKKAIGRPKGEKGIMEAYRQRLLNSPSSRKVIEKVFEVALEDGHSHQAACMKMILDRVLPTSGFSEVVSGGQSNPQVNITITGIGEAKVSTESAIEEGEYEEYRE
jgi:hypothetical protein